MLSVEGGHMLGKPVKSAERALAVFEYFAEVQRSLTVTEIASGMGMPVSSTSALMKSLVLLGYLDYNARKRTYYPTLRITLLGTWMERRHSVIGRIPSLLSKLVEKTNETALIATRNGIFAQYVVVQVSSDPLRLDIQSGMLRPLACTATGWSLLLQVPDSDIGRIVRRTEAEAVRKHWRDRAHEAYEQIALARQRGYAMSHGQGTEGAATIAVPIQSAAGYAPFAVGVGGAIERIERKKSIILTAMQDLLKEINAAPPDTLWRDFAGDEPRDTALFEKSHLHQPANKRNPA
jgi:DNA-binding IclR family transcriptional regulator